jgi:HEAT repeat protein
MSSTDKADIATLAARLADTDADARADAAERLCRAGDEARTAAVPLVRACGDANDSVRDWAVAALEELGPPPAADIATLTTLAGERHALVAYWAVTLLGRSGKDAAAATPVLAACLTQAPDPAVTERAAWALGKIGPAAAAARPALEQASGAPDPRLARLAQQALDSIGA